MQVPHRHRRCGRLRDDSHWQQWYPRPERISWPTPTSISVAAWPGFAHIGRAALDPELPDLEKLEWTHRRTQRLRFAAFLHDHDVEGASLLDVGCGLGDFYAYLHERGLNVEYMGFDISPAMIRQCRDRFGEGHFACGEFLDIEPQSRFDYTVAFGIHNIRVQHAYEVLEHVTRHQFALSRVAAHVSLLTDRYTSFAPHIQPWPAEQILTMALEITPFVALHHDYLENDFSITLYRAPVGKGWIPSERA